MKKDKGKINYNIIFLRFLAIILVVLGHSMILYCSNWNLISTKVDKVQLFDYIKQNINLIQMQLFFSISGYLFYNSKINNKIDFIKKKFIRLIIPFLIFGTFYMIPIRLLINYKEYKDLSFLNIYINKFLLGFDNGHLWYLPTLFIMFIIFLFYNKKCKKTYDLLFLLILLFMPLILNKMFAQTYLYNVLYYLLFFYFGLTINKYHIQKNKYNFKFIIIPITICICLTSLRNYIHILKNPIFIRIFQLIIIYFLYNIDFEQIGRNKIIEFIADNSFGVYLLHSPLVYITFTYLNEINPFLMVAINFFGLGSLCLVITYLLGKSKLKIAIGK